MMPIERNDPATTVARLALGAMLSPEYHIPIDVTPLFATEDSALESAGSVLLGQPPATASTLENQMGSDVHIAMAPHSKFLGGVNR